MSAREEGLEADAHTQAHDQTQTMDFAQDQREDPVPEQAFDTAQNYDQGDLVEKEQEQQQQRRQGQDNQREQTQMLELASVVATISETAPTPVPRWRQFATSIGGYLSPFKRRTPQPTQQPLQIEDRKRAATDEMDNIPSAKRSRTEKESSKPENELQIVTQSPTPSRQSTRPSIAFDAATSFRPTPSKLGELTSSSRKRSAPAARTETLQQTPRSAKSLTPHTFTGPSTHNRRVPTTLGTITENTEQSAFPQFNSTTSTEPPISTPSRVPRRRSIKDVRAMHEAKRQTPTTGSYTWEQRGRTSTTPKPPPPSMNADQRYEKLARYQALQRDIEARLKEKEELEKDGDIEEMRSHKRRKVHVDSLVAIPHRKPEDPAGTFRVPDWDSDDEMEVDENVEERVNVFEQAQQVQQEQQKLRELEKTVQQAPERRVQEVKVPSTVKWTFPSLGKRRPAQSMGAEETGRCKAKFTSGLNRWSREVGLA